MPFRKDFVWGTATASYQIEGAFKEDGKSLNIWDVFSKQNGRIYGNHNGDIACDHYHRIEEDVALMKKLGLKAYRFSVSWSRIIPDGVGTVNQKGIDFYNKLIDELIKNDIEPYMTIFHWDLPYILQQKGGWVNPEIPAWFENYTKVVVDNFSDRVKYFFTINEPECFVGLGLSLGTHAPGLKLSNNAVLQAIHNTLLAHGKAISIIRKYAKQPAKIGFAACGSFDYPYTHSKEDIETTRKVYDSIQEFYAFDLSTWLEPVFFGKYPDELLEKYKDIFPSYTEEEMKIISQPMDFLGLNFYRGKRVRAGKNGEPEFVEFEPGYPMTGLNWEITPECIYWGTKFIYEKYKLPIIISEHGLSNKDFVFLDGQVHDPQRIDFIASYLKELKKAVDDGVDVLGYFHWSLIDNFEWSAGLNERFGLIYVDYNTQKRIIKDSGYYYRELIKTNGDNL